MEAQLNQTFGDYKLEKKLGQGGMAVTYIARESMDGIGDRLVAIKQILPEFAADPNFRQMFYDEVRVTSLLTHRNICRIYRAGEVDGSLFMAMEFVDGMPLEEMVELCQARGYLIPMDHALHMVSQTLEGLHAAHTQKDADGEPLNLVHRDVSPQNLLVSRKAELKLIDFGVAKAASNMTKTQAGAIKGKILYLSPEQLQGQKLDGRSDLYSVGLMLYELLTGIHPFKGQDETSTIYNYITKELEPPSAHNPNLPAEIDHFMMRALARERDERYQSAAEMARGITDVLYAISPAYRGYHFEDFVHWCFKDDTETPPPSPFAQGADPSTFSSSGPALATGPSMQGFASTAPAMSAPSLASAQAASNSNPNLSQASDPALSGVQPQTAQPSSRPTGLIAMIVVLVLLVIGGIVVLAVTLLGEDKGGSESDSESAEERLDDSGEGGASGDGADPKIAAAGGDSGAKAGGDGGQAGDGSAAGSGGDGDGGQAGGDGGQAGAGAQALAGDPTDDEDTGSATGSGGQAGDSAAKDSGTDSGNSAGAWGSGNNDSGSNDSGDSDSGSSAGAWGSGSDDPDDSDSGSSAGAWGSGSKDSGSKDSGDSDSGSSAGAWGSGSDDSNDDDSGDETATKETTTRKEPRSSSFNPTKPSSVKIEGQALKTVKILMIQFPDIEGTRVETYYRLALNSQNMKPKDYMTKTWDLCQHVKRKPWTSKEKRAIDSAFGGSDPCKGFYGSPDPRSY